MDNWDNTGVISSLHADSAQIFQPAPRCHELRAVISPSEPEASFLVLDERLAVAFAGKTFFPL